jgi:hypothetical protein
MLLYQVAVGQLSMLLLRCWVVSNDGALFFRILPCESLLQALEITIEKQFLNNLFKAGLVKYLGSFQVLLSDGSKLWRTISLVVLYPVAVLKSW